MAANSATSVVDLDFDTIKNNLKTFLQSQSNIQDYDYEGSNINTILDVLSYNTFLNNFYANMIANEMFLDTAQVRNSIVSHAKELNYVPRSSHAAVAYVDIVINPADAPLSINIDKFTKFNGSVGGVTYNFSTNEEIIVRPVTYSNGYVEYKAANVALYEGSLVTEYFTAASDTSMFTLSNRDVDTRFIQVNVRESSTSTTNSEWTKATTLFGLSPTSNVYFIEPAQENKYSITFGDGVFGRKPSSGNIVKITYRNVSAEDGNRAKTFTKAQTIQGYSNIVLTTVATSSGGRGPESISDIKYNAPRSFQVQERAVTTSDYEILTLSEFPDVQSVQAFGGQELTPPRFGKVIVAVDLEDADGVSDSKKSQIEDYLNSRSPVSIDVEVVSPQFMYLDVTLDVRYNVSLTTQTPAAIESKSTNALLSYAAENINSFAAKFRHSKATNRVDASDSSIISSQLNYNLYFIVERSNSPRSYTFEFFNKLKRDSSLSETNTIASLYEPAIYSSAFTFGSDTSAQLMDNGTGALSVVRLDALTDRYIVLKSDAGTINYDTGKVDISTLTVTETVGTWKLFARLVEDDAIAKNETILQLNAADIKTTVIQERDG